MIKILQYGEGNFLRAFADAYFDTLNKEGGERYEVNIVKPAPFGSLEKFERQNNRYNVILRGTVDGENVEDVYGISCINEVIDPFSEPEKYYRLAADKDLKIIVSNTTEAGICYSAGDSFDGFEKITYPAKLTKFLYERYKLGLPGVHILPVELIDNNADELFAAVEKYISLWGLPEGFRLWNRTENHYSNTLVDRIVSGYPRDEETRLHLEALIGEADGLMTVGEPFGLWVIENKGKIGELIKDGTHNIEVILTDDIGYYKKRKVRVLNGSHTNLVAAGLMLGADTVYDCMTDAALSRFVVETLREEINPFVSSDLAATTAYAEEIKSRFLNPFLNHRLISISLNSVSKWRARVLPSFKDYYKKNGKIPPHLTVGFSYLMALYSGVTERDGGFTVTLPAGECEFKDDTPYLRHFASGGSISEFMRDASVWGEDLTLYEGFLETVTQNVLKIKEGISLL